MNKRTKDLAVRFVKDLILSVAASVFAFLLLRWVTEPVSGFSHKLAVWTGVAATASAIGLFTSNFYKRERKVTSINSVLHLLGAILIKEVLLVTAIFVGLVQVNFPAEFSILLLSDFVFTLLMCQFVHISRGSQMKNVRQISAAKTVLVVGTDDAAIEMARSLDASETFSVVGLISEDKRMDGRILADYPVYYSASPDNMEELRWKLGGIDCIFFTRSGSEDAVGKKAESAGGRKSSFSKSDLFVKRSFDLTVSFILLVVFSPLIALCSLLIKLDDGGPVFYRQERMGKGGRPFFLVKFRSMRTDAESMGVPALCSGEDDPRLTRIGRFLRAHHLDELPQLWNVFVGDMSFVGYRPERAYFINQIMQRDNRFQYLFQLAPGVTSYSTLYNGYTDTIEKMITRLDHDIYYLRSRSLWFDAKILALTFLSIVSGKKF